jgi:hypothetical protein
MTATANQFALDSALRLAPAFESHHVLDYGLTLFCNLRLFSSAIGAVFAKPLHALANAHFHELIDFVPTFFALGHSYLLRYDDYKENGPEG